MIAPQELRDLAIQSGIADVHRLVHERQLVWAIQHHTGGKPCFRTDKRFECEIRECPLRTECRRMIASWKL